MKPSIATLSRPRSASLRQISGSSVDDVPLVGQRKTYRLKPRRLGIDTHAEAVVFLRKDCPVCRSEGFEAHSRIVLTASDRHIVATLYQLQDPIIGPQEAILSERAWKLLEMREGDDLVASHLEPIDSLSSMRARVYGHRLSENAMHLIVRDIVAGHYSDLEIGAFLTACTTKPLAGPEVLSLTRAMVSAGDRLAWDSDIVADKHSAGGLPGNRTTPIIVPIIAALGFTMPKTSSRAITSPAGTADVMETLAPINLDLQTLHRVVETEGGCIAWGGSVRLSPADDILIGIERALDIDAEGQMIASVLSKKVAAGATHVIIDLPVGPTAKIRTEDTARRLERGFLSVGRAFGLTTRIVASDGRQPVGRGIGPALEAREVLRVLQNDKNAPSDLRAGAIALAGGLLELVGAAKKGKGAPLAAAVLADGRAWAKFQRICEAQGGMRTPPVAQHRSAVLATRKGHVSAIDNRRIARLAKLAGAPAAKAAGVELHVKLDGAVEVGEPLCTVHADAPGELDYALAYAGANPDIFFIESSGEKQKTKTPSRRA